MNLDYDGNLPQVIVTAYQIISFSLFAAINVGSIIASAVFAWWFFKKLKTSRTNLRDFIGSVALAKLNLWGWSAANMWAMIFSDNNPPIESLPFRIGWLFVLGFGLRSQPR